MGSMKYTQNDSGYTTSKDGYKTQNVFAPKNGVPGHMIPGQPDSWHPMNQNQEGEAGERLKAKIAQHKSLLPIPQRVGMSRDMPNANDFFKRYDAALTAPTPKAPPKAEETVTPIAPVKPPAPVRTGPIASETRVDAAGNVQTGRDLSGKLTFGDAVDYLKMSTK